jgi:hypothetical protein
VSSLPSVCSLNIFCSICYLVATVCFSCSPPDLNSSKLRSLAVKITKVKYVNTILKSKLRGPLFQATVLIFLTLSLSLYSYQTDERAKPGNLLTIDAFSPSPQQSVSHSPLTFALLPLSLCYFNANSTLHCVLHMQPSHW